MSSVNADLIAAKALIADPAHWVKGEYDNDGCYCALGAAFKSIGWKGYGLGSPVEEALIEALPPGCTSVPEYNDRMSTTHADIMALFDRAIEATTPPAEGG